VYDKKTHGLAWNPTRRLLFAWQGNQPVIFTGSGAYARAWNCMIFSCLLDSVPPPYSADKSYFTFVERMISNASLSHV
jgi:hypothetical protein